MSPKGDDGGHLIVGHASACEFVEHRRQHLADGRVAAYVVDDEADAVASTAEVRQRPRRDRAREGFPHQFVNGPGGVGKATRLANREKKLVRDVRLAQPRIIIGKPYAHQCLLVRT